MGKDPSAVIPKKRSAGTPSRSYVHLKCGSATLVDGHEFLVLADPFAFVNKTLCEACEELEEFEDVVWTDTKESIANYRRRVRTELSPLAFAWAYAVGPIVGATSGGVIGACWPPHTVPEIVTGVLAGGIIGWFLQVPARKYFGLDFRSRK